MSSLDEVAAKLDCLIDPVDGEPCPVTIAGQRANAVLVGEEDWQAIQELFPTPWLTCGDEGGDCGDDGGGLFG